MADEQNEVQKEEIVILEKDDGDITPLEDLDKKEEQVETPKLQKKPINNAKIGKYSPKLRELYIERLKKEAGLM